MSKLDFLIQRLLFSLLIASIMTSVVHPEPSISQHKGKSYFQMIQDLSLLGRQQTNNNHQEQLLKLNFLLKQKLHVYGGNLGHSLLIASRINKQKLPKSSEKDSYHFQLLSNLKEASTGTQEIQADNDVNETTTASTTSESTTSFPVTTTVKPQPVQSHCGTDIERVLASLISMEPWALQLIDAWGKPSSSFLEDPFFLTGSYHECRNVVSPPLEKVGSRSFRGNYCANTMHFADLLIVGGFFHDYFTKEEAGTNSESCAMPGNSDSDIRAHFGLQLGLCMPDTCTENEITDLLYEGLAMLNITPSVLIPGPTECRTDYREYTTASVLAIVFLSMIGAMMLIGTAYDLTSIQWPKWSCQSYDLPVASSLANGGEGHRAEEERHYNGRLVNHDSYLPIAGEGPVYSNESQPILAKSGGGYAERGQPGKLGKVLLAFSVYTNGSKVLNTSQPPGSLQAINGIRFLSMTWVILGHVWLFTLPDIENVVAKLPELMRTWTFDVISNAVPSVDTFFTLSGLLTSYLTVKEMMRRGWKINWGLFYFHRFWRLTPPYMLVLLSVLGLQRFMGSGALWSSTQPADKVFCEKNWWTNLLYINNLVHFKEMCFSHSWYLANDMQFFIISPLMIIPFYFNKLAGVISCLVFLLAQWITTGVLSTDNEWAPTGAGLGIKPMNGSLDRLEYYYMAPYCRIGPFVIGVLAGSLLATANGRVRMNKYTALFAWIVAISTGLAVIYGIDGSISGDDPLNVEAAAFYNAVSKSAWGACVCWVIVACVSGYGGPINTLLSWPPFVTLGRLTYMAYLIHPCLIHIYIGNLERPYFSDETSMLISYLGILLFTYMASFVLMLGLESPMIGLEKVFLGKYRK